MTSEHDNIDWDEEIAARRRVIADEADAARQSKAERERLINERLEREHAECVAVANELRLPDLLRSYRDNIWKVGEVVEGRGISSLTRKDTEKLDKLNKKRTEVGVLLEAMEDHLGHRWNRTPSFPVYAGQGGNTFNYRTLNREEAEAKYQKTQEQQSELERPRWAERLVRSDRGGFGSAVYSTRYKYPRYIPESEGSWESMYDADKYHSGSSAQVIILEERGPSVLVARGDEENEFAVRARVGHRVVEKWFPEDVNIYGDIKAALVEGASGGDGIRSATLDEGDKEEEGVTHLEFIRRNIARVIEHRDIILEQTPESYQEFERYLEGFESQYGL